jgi:hypothetical protein
MMMRMTWGKLRAGCWQEYEQAYRATLADKAVPGLQGRWLDINSSLAARKELATDLGYPDALDGSAAMHLWFHRAVMPKLADHGGLVPPAWLH